MGETSPLDERFDRRLLASIAKSRQRGLSWVVKRAVREVQIPTSLPGRMVRNPLAWVERGALRSIATLSRALPATRPVSRRTLYFFLDLELTPITFDIVT